MALRSRELIYRREESAFSDSYEFVFKHDPLREVTYESVLKRLRKIYLGMVADWLLAHGAERMAEFCGLIAGHLLEANPKEQAAEYFLRAGETALNYANCEAEVHFRMAGKLVTGKAQRAACQAGLGEVLSRQGTREEAARFLREAITLYEDMGKLDQMAHLYTCLSRVLWYVDCAVAWDACQEGLHKSNLQWLKAGGEAVYICQILVDIHPAGGYRWQHARKLVDLGDALALRNLPGDRQRALETYQQSLKLFSEMGSPGYARVLEERSGRMS